MVDSVQSFLCGHWIGGRDGQALRDAARGQVIAQTVIGDVDPAQALAYARGQGRRALLAVGFPERAAMLRALARYLSEHKEVLYRLSLHTGATRADGQVDIDGGIGTLAAYASMGAAELPAGNLWPEGAVVSLSRHGGFAGTHVLTPRAGVAVQINAFVICFGAYWRILLKEG